MKAIVQGRYGSPDFLQLEELEKPVVKDDQALVRVHAASANPADWHLIRGDPYIARLSYGLRRPKDNIPGCDLAGRVEGIGESVTRLEPGDEVFGTVFAHGSGAFAEYVCASEDLLERKPDNFTFEQAAAVPLAGMTALQGLRDHGRVEPGHKVLIIGASGGVGTFAVQIAKSLGADVTGVCSTRNVGMVRSIGANQVIDYTREDFAKTGERYDVIFQLAGTRSPSDCRRALTPKGTLILSSGESNGRLIGPFDRIVKALVSSPFVSQRMAVFTVRPNRDDLRHLSELIEAGMVTPVIDGTYSLSDVADAIRYLEQGHARGKVVITA
jgi:NADPH:quinone reductase-like Zn-dependent oxidoreductase